MALDTNDDDDEEVYFALPSSMSHSQKRKKSHSISYAISDNRQ